MNRALGLALDRAGFVDRLADDVQDAAEDAGADGHRDRVARVLDRLTADEAVRRVHGDAANRVLAEVLCDLDGEVVFALVDRRVREQERRVDLGKLGRVEGHVDDGTDDLDHAAHAVGRKVGSHVNYPLRASAPPTISASSLVIDA